MLFKCHEVLEGISEVRPSDMIVMAFRDEAIGLIIEADIFVIYYMLNRLTKVYSIFQGSRHMTRE